MLITGIAACAMLLLQGSPNGNTGYNAANYVLAEDSGQNSALIHTTREYYFDVPDAQYSDALYISDFSMILVFNIGVTMQNELKEIHFKSGSLSLNEKPSPGGQAMMQRFGKCSASIDQGSRLKLEFFPDTENGKSGSGGLSRCTFEGTLQDGNISGVLTLFLRSGEPVHIQVNPG